MAVRLCAFWKPTKTKKRRPRRGAWQGGAGALGGAATFLRNAIILVLPKSGAGGTRRRCTEARTITGKRNSHRRVSSRGEPVGREQAGISSVRSGVRGIRLLGRGRITHVSLGRTILRTLTLIEEHRDGDGGQYADYYHDYIVATLHITTISLQLYKHIWASLPRPAY
jgi:hypothetical protein